MKNSNSKFIQQKCGQDLQLVEIFLPQAEITGHIKEKAGVNQTINNNFSTCMLTDVAFSGYHI